MSWDINRVTIIGRLTNAVELKFTQGGTAYAKISIAVGGRKNPDGTESTSFFNVTMWGKTAENIAQYAVKGQQLAVDGRLEQHSYNDKDGVKRSSVDIIAERVQLLQKPRNNGEQATDDNTDFYGDTGFNDSPVEPSF